MEPCSNTLLVQHLKQLLLPSCICLTALDDQLWYWSTLVLEMVDIDNDLYGQWTLKTWVGMDNGHRRYLVNEHWRIYWILMMSIHIYLLLFLIPTLFLRSWLETSPEFLIEQCSEVPVLDSNCWCSNVGPRHLAYCCCYYTAPQQSVIAIVYCTKQ